MWTNQPCSGTFQSGTQFNLLHSEITSAGNHSTILCTGYCPGPTNFKCCVKSPSGIPKIPEHNCKRHVIDAGYKILNKFPGYVKVVWCYANKPGEHGKGLALDFMVGVCNIRGLLYHVCQSISDRIGSQAYSPHGREIAEWVMNNAASLKVLYVIW